MAIPFSCKLDAGTLREGDTAGGGRIGNLQKNGDALGQAHFLHQLARFSLGVRQLETAGDATLRLIDILLAKGQDFLLFQSHHVLGMIYRAKGEKEKATVHFETAQRRPSKSRPLSIGEKHYFGFGMP